MQCRCCSSGVQIQIFHSVHLYFTFPLPSSSTLLLTSSPFNLFRPSDQQFSSFISLFQWSAPITSFPLLYPACQSPPSTLFPFCNFFCFLHTALPFFMTRPIPTVFPQIRSASDLCLHSQVLIVNLYIHHSSLTSAGELRVEEACCS